MQNSIAETAKAAPALRKMFKVTRFFTGGILEGLTHTETTPVEFKVGFVCNKPAGGSSTYRIIAVEPVN